MRTLSQNTQNKIASAVELGIKADKAGAVALDCLIADGFDKVSDYVSPKSEGSTVGQDEWDTLRAAIVMGFSKTAQDMLETPTKSLERTENPSECKLKRTTANKKYWQQQINARIGDFKGQLAKRLEKEGGGASRTRTIDEWFRDFANDGIKKCRNAEEAPFDINEMLAALNKVLALAKR